MKAVLTSPAWMISRAIVLDERDVGADVRGRARRRRTAPSSCGAGRRRRAWRRCGRPAGRGGRRSGGRHAAFDPHITMTSVSSISAYDEVPPPAPNTVARPTTRGSVSSAVAGVDVVGADHRPGELLGDEVHLVGRLRAGEEARSRWPPCVSRVVRKPSAARPSASSQRAGRSSPLSRTRGCVSRCTAT